MEKERNQCGPKSQTSIHVLTFHYYIHVTPSIELPYRIYWINLKMNATFLQFTATLVFIPPVFIALMINIRFCIQTDCAVWPLSFQMNRPIQVKPADSESRGGKRHLSPPCWNTCSSNTFTFNVHTNESFSLLLKHLFFLATSEIYSSSRTKII